MNSIRNGIGMRETEIARKPSRPWNPHSYAIFAQVHNSLQEVEAPDHSTRRDGTHTALAMTRRDDHDRAMIAASNIDLL